MKAKFIFENLPKNVWIKVNKKEYSEELIDLVQNAYKNSSEGSFINTNRDLIEPDWLAIDIDYEPDLEATIFYRGPRDGETWHGKKIQGIGHDGSIEAINVVLRKLEELLHNMGWWIEASERLEHILYKLEVPYVTDEKLAQGIFPKSDVKFTGKKGKYSRMLENGKFVIETIFGRPVIKNTKRLK